MSEIYSEVFLWFCIFVLAVDAGVFSLKYMIFYCCCFGVRSDAVVKCGSAFVFEVHTDSPPSVLPVFLV